MSGISVLTEQEAPSSWRFEITLPDEAQANSQSSQDRRILLTLSWVDYEYWCHGTASPSRVAETVVIALLAADPKRSLPDKFDASTARRWVRDLDQRIREYL